MCIKLKNREIRLLPLEIAIRKGCDDEASNWYIPFSRLKNELLTFC